MTYRTDIDGLRAVAVLSVILFHIDKSWLPGGFLGVDLFFTISGYLITLLLVKDISKTSKLNMIGFYGRRIKRIIPALFFMLVIVLLVGLASLAPADLESFLDSMIWSVLSFANIYFYTSIDTGYFAASSSELPLLHLWSLGVEEQFYFVWPFIVFVLIKYLGTARKQLTLVGSIIVASLVLAQITQVENHSFAYYMLPTRAWELLAGGFVALLVFHGLQIEKSLSEAFGAVGLLLIGYGLFFVSESDPVPGVAAIPTILGASLFILSNSSRRTFAGRILSIRLMVLVGLVSYSAYLWHWPILAFLRYSLIEIDVVVGVLVVVGSLFMAYISYVLIERPTRSLSLETKYVYCGYFLAPSFVIILSSLIVIDAIKDENSWVYPWEKLERVSASTKAAYAYDYNCQSSKFDTKTYQDKRCVYPANKDPSVLLIGDSNAAHYIGMMRPFADHFEFGFRNVSVSSCPPLLVGEVKWNAGRRRTAGCNLYRKTVREQALQYDVVIIGAAWNVYDKKPMFREYLKMTISDLSDQVEKVIILAKVPIMRGYNKECELRSIRLSGIDCSKRFSRSSKPEAVNIWLEKLASQYDNVAYFDMRKQVCEKGVCSPYFGDNPVYFDSGHLSMAGSELIGRSMLQSNEPMLGVFENIQ